ncbi:hypothetical protein SRHO_G00048880 [Serrasalmus rhombeus]
MSRESPSGWSVWDGNRETEAIPAVTTLDPEERGVQSDYEEYQPVTECVPAETPLVVPVTGESFCQCPTQTDLSSQTQLDTYALECTCGEDESGCVWVWHEECKSPAVLLSCSNRKVSFHPDYSCGTAAVRGSAELRHGQHFWEIKMTSPVYGTDMMVGIGTPEVNLDQFRHSFCSMLGADAHSWGLSYTGLLHHKGSKVSFSPRFGQGSIIGLHLDTWHGTLTFYKNRRWIGVAATGLRNKSFYPMVCSTAAKSSMKVISSVAAPTSLQYLCCIHLRDYLPDLPDALSALPLPPGLKLQLSQQLGWVLRLRRPEASTHTCAEDSQPGHAPSTPDSAHCTPADICLTFRPDSASYFDDDNAAYPDSAYCTPAHTYLSSHPDSASCKYVDPDLFSDLGSCSDSASCSDPASCPCCDAPLSLATCGHDDCLSSASCCSGPAFRPTSPLPDQSCCPSSPDPAQSRPGATSGSDSDSCTSETCQRKRCRWT